MNRLIIDITRGFFTTHYATEDKNFPGRVLKSQVVINTENLCRRFAKAIIDKIKVHKYDICDNCTMLKEHNRKGI